MLICFLRGVIEIDKKEFINCFEYEDEMLLSALYEKLELCIKADIDVYSEEFYPPNVWVRLERRENSMGVDVETFGFFEDSERRMVLLKSRNYGGYSSLFPMKVLKIRNKSKFKELEHRHFLGTIMSLGIKREKLGDIVVDEGTAYVPVFDELADYIKDSIERVAKNPVSIEVLEYQKCNSPKRHFEDETVLVSSLRLDALVSSLCGVSRNEAVKLIDGSQVSLNYFVETGKNSKISEGDTVSVRKYGKYLFEKIEGSSKKGKYRLLIKKFL